MRRTLLRGLLTSSAVALWLASPTAATGQIVGQQSALQSQNVGPQAAGTQSRAEVNPLQRPVSLDVREMRLGDVLAEISTQADLGLMYGNDLVPVERPITANFQATPAGQALSRVLAGTDMEFTLARNQQVMLVKRPSPPPPSRPAAQTGAVMGVVTDRTSGQPVAGAQVFIEASNLGSITQANGRYLITNVPAGTHTVVARMVGYSDSRQDNVRVERGGSVTLDFEMRTSVFTLEEIVVTGVADPIAGIKVPFSIGKVSREDLATVPTSSSVASAIQGKVAGVAITRAGGQPGSDVHVQIRSPTSIEKSTTPMYIIDGVILSSVEGTTVDLEALDIESIEVVKGAAAASLYGSKASSGVISIRTTRGSGLPEGKTQITVRSEMGQSAVPTGISLANHHHFLTNEQGQWLNASGNVAKTLAERVVDKQNFGIMDKPYGQSLYNNVKAMYQPSQFMTNSVSLSQNTRQTNFMVSFNNRVDRGALENNDGYHQYTARLNLDHRLSEKFNLGGGFYHSRGARDDLSGQPFYDLLMAPPDVNFAAKDENGEYLMIPDPTYPVWNPIWHQGSRDNLTKRARTMVNGNARVSPYNWLNFEAQISYDRADVHGQVYVPRGTPTSLANSELMSSGTLTYSNTTVDALNGLAGANLLRTFGDLTSRVRFQVGMERELQNIFSASGDSLLVEGVKRLTIAGKSSVSSMEQEVRTNTFLAQTGLDYAGKYIGDFLIRRDGVSLFGPESRWQTYYRGAFSYLIGRESWFSLPHVDELKLRYAIGTSGGRPGFSNQYETWTVGSTGAVSRSTLGNRHLRPERTTEQEIGVDAILFDRFSLELTYASQVTRDQLVAMVVPAATGYTTQYQNSGTITGHTYEATLQAQVVDRRDFSWRMTMIADRSRNKITEWNRPCYQSGATFVCQGSDLSEMYGERHATQTSELRQIHANSLDQFQVNDDGYLVPVGSGNSWKDGISKALWGTDVTIDGVKYPWGVPILVTDEDGLPVVDKIGSSNPDLNFGWLNQFNWKGIALHTHVHAQVGGTIWNATKQRLYQYDRHGDLDQSGKPSELKKPEPYYYTLYNRAVATKHFVEDASFVKLREVSLQYQFNKAQLAKIGLGGLGTERISVGLIGRNLVSLHGYSGFDPEVGSPNLRIDSFGWPPSRQLTGMIEITF